MKKHIKIAIVMFLLLIVLFGIAWYVNTENKVAVLGYHDVVDFVDGDEKSTVNISTKKFKEQMKWLHEHHYKTISMDEFYEWKINKKKIPRKSVLITFDDGWKSYYTKVIPILEEYGMKSSVFVVWKYAENCTENNDDTYMNYVDIKDIVDNHRDMKILSHSYELHLRENANSNDYELYKSDMERVSKFIPNSKYYAYPFGIKNDNYIKALKDSDYNLAFTFGPYDFTSKKENNYEISRLGIFESTKYWKFKLKMFLEM